MTLPNESEDILSTALTGAGPGMMLELQRFGALITMKVEGQDGPATPGTMTAAEELVNEINQNLPRGTTLSARVILDGRSEVRLREFTSKIGWRSAVLRVIAKQ
jgi:hypothetical protein